MEIKKTCPLGHTCEKAVDGHIERCAWYTHLEGMHPQTGDRIDRWECAIAWQPVLTIELAGAVQSGNATMQSMRNNLDQRQGEALKLIASSGRIAHDDSGA